MSFPGMSEEQIRQLLLQLSLAQPGQAGSDPTASLDVQAGIPALGSRLGIIGPHNPVPAGDNLLEGVGAGVQGALNARGAPGQQTANERLARLGAQLTDPDLMRVGSVAPPTNRLDAIRAGLETGGRHAGNLLLNYTPPGWLFRAGAAGASALGQAGEYLTEAFDRPVHQQEDPYPPGFETGAPKLGQPGFIGPLPVAGQAGSVPLGQHRMPDGTLMPDTAMPGMASGAARPFGSERPAGKDDWATRPGVTPQGGAPGAGAAPGGAGPGAAPPGGGGLAAVPPAGTAGAAGGALNAEFQKYIQEVDPGAYADLLNQQRGRDPNRDFWSGLENRQAGVAQSLFPIMEDTDPTNNENEFANYLRGNLEGRRQPGGRTDFRGALLARLGDPDAAREMLGSMGVAGDIDQNQIASVANNVGKLVETVQTQGGRFGALARQRGIRARQAVMAAFSQSIQGGGTALSDADLARIIQQHLQ